MNSLTMEPSKKLIRSLIIALLMLPVVLGSTSGISHALTDADYERTLRVFQDSPTTQEFFNNAYGYAIFPLIGKGGIGVGGSFGTGRVYRQGEFTGRVSQAKLSLGFQLGGQAFMEIIFFQDKRAYTEFTSGSFEFDATASAVAITAGVQAKAGTAGSTAGASSSPTTGKQFKARYHKGMAVFVHSKGGLMYEATIGGQAFNFEPLTTPGN